MSKRTFLRKSAVSLAATMGLGGIGTVASAQIVLPPNLTIGVATVNPGLMEGRVAGAFNITDPNPGQVGAIGGIKLEPIIAQTPGSGNNEPWPDNTTYIYTGQMFFPNNTGTGTSQFALAEHVDDSTQIKIDGIERLNNTQWDVPNTTGVLSLPTGWHDVEFRFGEGGGGWGPSNSGGWTNTLGFGVDFTLPIAGDTTQANYVRPVDPGNATVFRVTTYNTDTSRDGQSVTVNSNATLSVLQGRTVPLGALTVANGTTFTVESPGGTTKFTEANIGSTVTFAVNSGTVSSGPLKSTGAVTTINKTGAGTLLVPTSLGSNVTSNPTVNVTGGTLSVALSLGTNAASVGGGPINLTGSTLALANDTTAPNGPGVFATTGSFYQDVFALPVSVDNGNGGWTGLNSKTSFDAALAAAVASAPSVLLATIPINTRIDWPNGGLADGGTNDVTGTVFDNISAPAALQGNSGDPWVAKFAGKLNVTTAGSTQFFVGSNDGAVLFVDLDLGPGTNWQKVADNNRSFQAGAAEFEERGTGQTGALPTITQLAAPTLAVGQYDYLVGMYNTTALPDNDEGGLEVSWIPAGGSKTIIPYAISTGPVTLANTLTVSGNSGIDVQAPSATLTNLRMDPGSSLTARGNALTTGVTATGAGTVTIGTIGAPVTLTTLSDGGNAVTFVAGPGEVTLSRVGGPGPGFGATSAVGATTGGRLVASNDGTGATTLAGAPVTLSGGTLELHVITVPGPGATMTAGLLEGRVSGGFNTTTPNPGTSPNPAVGGIKLEPILAQTAGSGNVEPWPDNTTHVYTGQFLVPDNGTAGDGIGEVAFAEHFDDNTLVRIDGVDRINNQQWDVPNTTGALTLSAGWHDIELRFGEGGGGWGPSASGGWDNTLGFGIDTTLPIEGDTNQANYVRPVDDGSMNLFRVITGPLTSPNFQSNVTATENSAINVVGATTAQIGSVNVAAGKTLTVTGKGLTMSDVTAGAGGVVSLTGPYKVTGSLNGAGTLLATKNSTVDFTKSGAAATGSPKLDIARGAVMNFTPGASNTFGAAAVSTIANEGLVHAANGVTDMSGAVMTTTNLPGFAAGLLGGRVEGGTNAVDLPSAADSAGDLRLSRAQTTDVGFFGGNNGSWVYRGEIKIPDTDGDGIPGPIAFGKQFDDWTLLKIDGVELINSLAWDQPHSTGPIEMADTEPDGAGTPGDGWFTFEGRFGDTGGGIGPNNNANAPGWTDLGFGIDTDPSNGFDVRTDPATNLPLATRTQYVEPVDNGTMNLFRFNNPALENIRVDAGATLKLGAIVGTNIVNVNGRLELHGPTTSKMAASGLNIAGTPTAPTGTLDLTDSAIALDYPTAGPNPAADIRARIIVGRGGTGLGKPWNGKGITSSQAQADVAASPNSRSVGYAVNGDLPLGALTTFRGQPVDPTTVLMRYTRTGDANLDGVVNDDDVTVVGTFYAPGVPKPEWAKGDFDYNGFVDDDDVTLLGVFYNPSAPPIPTPDGGGVAAVPEPASWLMLTLGGLGAGLFGWRKRRRKVE